MPYPPSQRAGRRIVLAVALSLSRSATGASIQPFREPPALAQPYPPLQGGSFSGPPLAFHADPLGSYVWSAGVNASALQVFAALPDAVEQVSGSASAFSGASSLLGASPRVSVSGAGSLRLFYAAELAGWLEFDSPDLTAADAARVTMGVSEYGSGPTLCNLGLKEAAPTAHALGDGNTTWRLETLNPGLFEGVRFAWLSVNATPAAPWTITGFRLVAQVKPTNWGGAFSAPGDVLLSKIWYIGAYTVKVNLLSDQFGSILIYRGDRFSWTGDAHVAQATAMAALGNFDFVFENIFFTRNNCNGIESYCLYLALSVTDFYAATGNATAVAVMAPFILPKLEHAAALVFNTTTPKLGFYSWDDRK